MCRVGGDDAQYVSGKGEQRSINLIDLLNFSVSSVDQFAFALAAGSSRVYEFRAQDRDSFRYWIQGLQACALALRPRTPRRPTSA